MDEQHIDENYAEGCKFFSAGSFVEAEQAFRRGLGRNPEDAEWWNALGTVLDAQKKYEEAVLCYRKANKLDQYNSIYRYNEANTQRRIGDMFAAEAAYIAAIQLDPRFADAIHGLGNLYIELSRLDEAAPLLEMAVKLQPEKADGFYDIGQLLLKKGLFSESVPLLTTAMRLEPEWEQPYNALGVVLLRLNRYEEAHGLICKAHDINPEANDVLSNMGVCYHWSGQVGAALSCFEKVINRATDDADNHFNYAMALLTDGRFREGWLEYEWRFLKARPILQRHQNIPRWCGEDLTGKRILIHAEQGYGDAIQFIRYAQLLADEGAIVLVEGQDEIITPLLKTARGVSCAFTRNEPVPPADFQLPMMSLPFVLDGRAWPPPQSPYVAAPDDSAHSFKEALASHAGIKVGIAWAGRREHENDVNRSLSPELLTPLFAIHNITLISLQFGIQNHSLDAVTPLFDLTQRANNFADSAALVSCLDLIITVDSAIAHLAGALSKQVWLMLPYSCDWRWMRDRADSPWYPSMRLFRQSVPGSWEPVIASISSELTRFTNQGAPESGNIVMEDMMALCVRKLHIGATAPTEGWETLNALPLAGIDHIMNARDLSVFPDKTFVALYASHVVEHFDYKDDLIAVLREWYRVIAPGGMIYISVPDMDKLCRLFLLKEHFDVNDRFMFMRMLFGGHVDAYDYHQTGLNEEFLAHYLLESGFSDISRVNDFGLFSDTSTMNYKGEFISLNVVAKRPETSV